MVVVVVVTTTVVVVLLLLVVVVVVVVLLLLSLLLLSTLLQLHCCCHYCGVYLSSSLKWTNMTYNFPQCKTGDIPCRRWTTHLYLFLLNWTLSPAYRPHRIYTIRWVLGRTWNFSKRSKISGIKNELRPICTSMTGLCRPQVWHSSVHVYLIFLRGRRPLENGRETVLSHQ